MQIEENTTDSQNSDQTDQSQDENQATDSGSTTEKTETDDDSGDDKVETKTDGDTILGTKGEETKDADKGDPEPNPLIGAPEGDYEISGLPENTKIDETVLGALVPIAKKIGISNEGMSELALAYNNEIMPHLVSTLTKQLEGDAAAQTKAWDAEARLEIEGGEADGKKVDPDPVYAGKNFADVRKVAARALDRFGGLELREYLEKSGLGNHPAIVRFAYQVGAAIKEDTPPRDGGGAKPKTDAEIFYG